MTDTSKRAKSTRDGLPLKAAGKTGKRPQVRITRDWAFYYPGPVWLDGNAVKNLILFFDGIAVLVPRYLSGKPFRIDPAIAFGLHERGLLREVMPEEFIDKKAADALAEQLEAVIAAGALDKLDRSGPFAELSMSRLGWDADSRLAERLFKKLAKRGLAKKSADGVSIPMHPAVRVLILVLLAQILAPRGPEALKVHLSPCTDRPQIVSALLGFLKMAEVPTVGDVVNSDIATVGIDLSAIPIDEVLSFRTEHGNSYRTYRRNLNTFVRDLASIGAPERQHELDQRREDIKEEGRALIEQARRAWRRPAGFGLGLAGALWSAKSGDPVYGLIGAGLALTGLGPNSVAPGVFSYLFQARQRFPRQ
jgi:hypothetical protein